MRQRRDETEADLEREMILADEDQSVNVSEAVTSKMGKVDASVGNMEHE